MPNIFIYSVQYNCILTYTSNVYMHVYIRVYIRKHRHIHMHMYMFICYMRVPHLFVNSLKKTESYSSFRHLLCNQ